MSTQQDGLHQEEQPSTQPERLHRIEPGDEECDQYEYDQKPKLVHKERSIKKSHHFNLSSAIFCPIPTAASAPRWPALDNAPCTAPCFAPIAPALAVASAICAPMPAGELTGAFIILLTAP
ncbi:hypothetical protein ACTXG9_08995 [Stenotrophomonas maltophilia group sp. LNF247]